VTGIRAGELAGLTGDALTTHGNSVSLRIPVGKLHNDRYVPWLPPLVELIANYQKLRGPIRSRRLLKRDDDWPFVRRTIHHYVERVANRAGVGHVDPHQLRHTMATQFMVASNNCNRTAKPRRRHWWWRGLRLHPPR
jgi:integrase